MNRCGECGMRLHGAGPLCDSCEGSGIVVGAIIALVLVAIPVCLVLAWTR